MMLYEGAAPCLSCGTTGGSVSPGDRRPNRRQGLCGTCYNRHHRQGRLSTARPCLSCAEARGIQGHGLCKTCSERARTQGIYDRYPACGAVPVPYQGPNRPNHPEHPDMPPPLDPIALNRHIYTTSAGRDLYRHHIGGSFRYAPDRIAADEQRALAWMRAHPDQAAIWDDPSLAMFPAREAVAA